MDTLTEESKQMRVALRDKTSLASLLTAATLTAVLVACGGGYGGGMMGMTGGAGCMSGAYSSNCPAPTITMKSPGGTVNRTVTLSASAAAAMGLSVMRVDFMVDGMSVGMATTSPYTLNWDSTRVADGAHMLTASVTDSLSQTSSSGSLSVTVDNNPSFTVPMAPGQILPAPTSGASGTASLAAKLANGAVSGKVMLSAVAATAVSINEAFAGNTGSKLITLVANGGTAGEWDVPAAALLTADQITSLLQGRLYVIASSAANPNGEIRGQITPANVRVIFSAMAGAQEVPPISIAASGVAATTVDSTANTLSVHVHAMGVDDALTGDVDNGAAGTTGARLTALAHDAVDAGHWSLELAPITAADAANFNASRWYVNLATPADPGGAIRGQIDVPSH
jgi:hypothetical protein